MKLKDVDCRGLIVTNPHQIPIKNDDPDAAAQCHSSVHPLDRTPIKNWKPGMRVWKCNHYGTRNGKKRYSCPHIVNDENALRLGLGKCLKCRKNQLNERKRNWHRRMVNGARRADKKKLETGKFSEIDWTRFITKEHMKQVYKICRKRCWWCGIIVREFERKHAEGLTVDRLTSGPHYLKQCTIACLSCNRISWRKKFNNIPWWAREEPTQRPELVFLDWWNRYQNFQTVLAQILEPTNLSPNCTRYIPNGRYPSLV